MRQEGGRRDTQRVSSSSMTNDRVKMMCLILYQSPIQATKVSLKVVFARPGLAALDVMLIGELSLFMSLSLRLEFTN